MKCYEVLDGCECVAIVYDDGSGADMEWCAMHQRAKRMSDTSLLTQAVYIAHQFVCRPVSRAHRTAPDQGSDAHRGEEPRRRESCTGSVRPLACDSGCGRIVGDWRSPVASGASITEWRMGGEPDISIPCSRPFSYTGGHHVHAQRG